MSESNFIYIVYKTTNLVNEKIYIGVHRQPMFFPIIFDGYLGSGKTMLKAIKKYGEQNFVRKTLHVYYTRKKAYEKEKEIVNDSFLKRKDVYNICGGGKGPSIFSESSKQKISQKAKERHSSGFIHPNTIIDVPSKEDLEYLYYYLHFSMKKISKIMEVSLPTIRKWLNNYEIPLKMPNERLTEEQKLVFNERMRNKFKSVPRSEEVKSKMRKQKSEQGRENIKLAIAKRDNQKITCPFCGKSCSAPNYKRWHGENCLYNPNISIEAKTARDRIKENHKGENNSMFGKKIEGEHRKNLCAAKTGKPHPQKKIYCKYCGAFSTTTNIIRWHNENCKFKP
jgi:hypothetical protein